ncbi:MAG: Spy/CpxP family protein refolding chaperone [Steroidobacteraceae bacterium]
MKLNRTLGLLLVATASVGAGAAAAATTINTTPAAPASTAATAPAPGGRHWHHRNGGMLVGVMLRATRQLNLTSEQQTAIEGILSSARAQHQANAGAAGVDFVTLANPGDPNYAAAVQNAKTAAANRLAREVELQGQIYNVLTADQKAKLPQVLADMKSKAEQRRAAWSQRGSEAGAAGSN